MSSVPLGVQYLVGTLLILAVLAVIAAVWAAQRRMIGLSALLATPHALSALLVVPHYWKPPSILVVGIALEDVLFMAGVGGWAWVYAVLMVRNRITVSPCVKRGARRYLVILAGCGVAGAAIAGLPGGDRMPAILSLMALVVVAGVALRRELWPLAVYGGLFSGLSYALTMLAGAVIWPDFMDLWRPENLWGPRALNVPLEEFAWGALFGPSWALVMAYVVDARIVDQPGGRFVSVVDG